MTDYVIEKVKYSSENPRIIEYAKVRMFNNTKRKPFYVNSYNLSRDQIIATFRADKTFHTFYTPDDSSRKPKIVDEIFLYEKAPDKLFLKIKKNDTVDADDLGDVPTINKG